MSFGSPLSTDLAASMASLSPVSYTHLDVYKRQSIDWDALRVEHLIPESGIELIPDETYLLEAGFERLHGVDFRKGCYVGQEVTARMKHKTELRKGLVTVGITCLLYTSRCV